MSTWNLILGHCCARAEKDRMEALAKSISGGIRTINEARATEGLSEVEGGDDIRVQQQDVPLGLARAAAAEGMLRHPRRPWLLAATQHR